jgi:flagellar protein FliS
MHASLYAPPAPQRRTQSAQLYARVGVESQLAVAGPHQLVAMLFDGFMQALAQARGAMRSRQRELKAAACSRAVNILEDGLRGGLDLKAGGALARDLDELYSYVTMRLTLANLHDDEAALDECQRLIQPLQEAWASIAPGAARPARP